jgi:hypothetical protein
MPLHNGAFLHGKLHGETVLQFDSGNIIEHLNRSFYTRLAVIQCGRNFFAFKVG